MKWSWPWKRKKEEPEPVTHPYPPPSPVPDKVEPTENFNFQSELNKSVESKPEDTEGDDEPHTVPDNLMDIHVALEAEKAGMFNEPELKQEPKRGQQKPYRTPPASKSQSKPPPPSKSATNTRKPASGSKGRRPPKGGRLP